MFQQPRVGTTWVLCLSLGLFGCSRNAETSSQPQPASVTELAGEPDDPAIDALFDVAPLSAPAEAIDAEGYIPTRIDVYLEEDATIAQVNAALDATGGAIVTMITGGHAVTVEVPQVADRDALIELATRFGEFEGVLGAVPGREAKGEELPPGGAGSLANLAEIDHLLAARFGAAWNARALAQGACTGGNKVKVVVADLFSGAENFLLTPYVPGYAANIPPTDPDEVHGANVTATLAAEFTNQNPTGAMPFGACLDISGIQIKGLTMNQVATRISQQMPSSGRFILNGSFGWTEEGIPALPLARATATNTWKTATESRWNEFLVVSSAGNEADSVLAQAAPGIALAGATSFLNLSTQADFAVLMDGSLFPVQTATLPAAVGGAAANVLITGSAKNECAAHNPQACTKSDFSDGGHHVLAIGEELTRFIQPTGLPLPAVMQGTTYAAPQVSGLAAYLWALDPNLKNSQPASVTKRAIEENTLGVEGFVDAYAAILSLDAALTPSPGTAQVRNAILDVDQSGSFDAADVEAYLQMYIDASGEELSSGTQDHSRYDLNGDGITGGPTTSRFDLDRVGSTQYGAAQYGEVEQAVAGTDYHFNENSVTDMDILCFYAGSALFVTASALEALIENGLCGEPPSATVLSFDEGLEGFVTGDAGGDFDSAGWDSDIGNPAGSLVLDGSDLGTPNDSPNSWASRSINIPAGAGALRFDTRATADGDGALRVLINDATLIDWEVLAGDSWVPQAANISAYAGQTVTLRFEQNDNDVGVGELRWVDNIRIEEGIPPD